jgi:serine/threonine protein kinase
MDSDRPGARPSSPPTLNVGQIVADTYRIVRRVGAGGMGEIYEATHLRLAGRYAIKLLRPEIASDADALARFEREARVTSALRHPNIVQVVDFSALPSGAPFMVMEFLDGRELAEVIKLTGPLPLPRVISLVRQIASGLTAAHDTGVVHRDLKPPNIFVLDVVGHAQELVKIVDFGISKVKDVTSTITDSSALVGTVQYMSPEQARGRVDEIDARTDQFALAAIVYELLVGKDAFTGANVSSLLYQIVHEEPVELAAAAGGPIPPAVASVLRRALAKDKGQRFASVLAFSAALEDAAAAGGGASATTVSAKRSTFDTPPPERSRRARVAWIATGTAVVAIFIAWFVVRPSRTPVAADAPAPLGRSPGPAVSAPPPPAPSPAVEASETKTPARADERVANRPARAHAPKPPRVSTTGTSGLAPAAASPKPNCDPNFFFDAQGDKHFKPACFLDEGGRR